MERGKHPSSFPNMRLRQLCNSIKKVLSAANSPPESIRCPYPTGTERQTVRLLYRDRHCAIVSDPYPKSTVHCLVVPMDPHLQSLNDLTKDHVQLLQHMLWASAQYAEHLRSSSHPKLRFISGFHSIPSLPPLHMHLISLDLDSDSLKHKKHYNSFATQFFLPTQSVIEDIGEHGEVTRNQQVEQLMAFEKMPLRCLWCQQPFEGMPELKGHIPRCSQNKSRDP